MTREEEPMSDYQKTIAVDFDGVIHKYSKGWFDGTCYDEPEEGAEDALRRLLKRGYKIAVFTCRAEDHDGVASVYAWFRHFMPELYNEYHEQIEVTDIKPKAIAYIDDRAIRFTNWKDVLNYF